MNRKMSSHCDVADSSKITSLQSSRGLRVSMIKMMIFAVQITFLFCSSTSTAFSLAPLSTLNTYKSTLESTFSVRKATETDESESFDPVEALTESEQFQAANDHLLSTEAAPTEISLPSEISNSFMQYALSIILGRALPDARDGLKPVHRRILYAMSGLGLMPGSSHRKCARVVGEVLGKYHPHGDTAVYDALVRLAQDFSTGTPLIDGHGNFGSIDNDPAAAMRYTECRLTRISAEALLDDLNLDTVDFIPNFDGNENEPVVLPAKLPVLLLNGCAGIAVGMATNVPPHNLCELMNACIALTSSREKNASLLDDDELFKLIPGPDFPTGASILGSEDSKKLYTSGNGGIIIRAVTNLEQIKGAKGKNRSAIIVTELPYQVNKAALMEKIANLVNDKKIDGISDLRDESDRDGIRMVIELKRDAVAAVVQTTFSGNFLAIMGDGTKPQRFTLRSALDYFLDFRFSTIRRKTGYQLQKVSSRAHIVDGLLVAFNSVDEVIETIRAASDQNIANAALCKKFNLTKTQSDAVLSQKLSQLTRLNKDKLSKEKETLEGSKIILDDLLEKDSSVRAVMKEEFVGMKDKFGTSRKTKIELEEQELQDLDLVRNSRSVIVIKGGYIKRMPLKTFENQKRGTRGKKGTSNSSTDNGVAHCVSCNDHDTLLMTTQKGIAYGLRAFQIPTGGRTAKGVPIPSVLPVKVDDVVTSILPVDKFSKDEYCALVTEFGWIKKTPLAAFENLSARGLIIASLDEGDTLKWCLKCTDDDDILIGSTKGLATRFEAAKLRPTGRTSRGVRSMRMKDGDTVADMNIISSKANKGDKKEYILVVTANGYGKRVNTCDFSTRARGGVGVIAMKFKPSSTEDKVSCLRVVSDDCEILATTSQGIIVRQEVKNISVQSRTATGVRVQKVDVDNCDSISSISIVPKYEEQDVY